MKKILLFSLVLVTTLVTDSWSQGRTISGKVTSIENGDALPGVNILINGTANGIITDVDGNYKLSIPSERTTLTFSFIGYMTQEVEIGARSVIDVTMLTDTKQLSEVVVTALGIERDERALGYAVQEVSSDAIVSSGSSSVVDALVGKVSGVQVTRSSGAAGGGSRILIRGVTSMIGDNQPLIVIDGVRTNNETIGSENNTKGTAQSNRLMDLNVNEIETLNVLKGAAATALYGTAGSTGVIVITTKKGKKGGGLNVNFSTQIAFDKITTTPKLQNKYAQGTGGVLRGPESGFARSWGPKISDLEYATDPTLFHNYYDPIYGQSPGDDDYVHPFDANGKYLHDKNGFLVPSGMGNGTPGNSYDNLGNFFQTGVTFTNSISISGGSDKATFRFSASDLNQEGITPNEEYLRKTISIASTLQATDALSFSATMNYARSDHQRIQQGANSSGLLFGLYRVASSFDNSNGFGSDAVDEPSSYIFPDGTQRNYRGGGDYDNPYWVVNNTLRDEEVHRMLGTFGAQYKAHDWVNLGLNLGVDVTHDFRKQNFEIGSQTKAAGAIILDEYTTKQTDFYLNIAGQGGLSNDIGLSYMVGMNLFNFGRRNTYTQGDALVFQGFLDISNAKAISATEDETKYRTLGFFGQVEASWRNTIFLTLTGRRDYDSRLVAPEEFDTSKIGFFYPSISASFAFTELLPTNDILSFGKIRMSWAQVGAPPPFAYLTSTPYSNTQGVGGLSWPINGVTAFELDNVLGNPDLKPERSTTVELGLDLRFFQGKIGLDMTYYDRKTKDAILNASLPRETGYTNIWLNAGKMSSKGVEITLNATPISKKNFNWDTQLNFTKNESIVEELAPGIERLFLGGFTTLGTYLVPGNQYGVLYGAAYEREQSGTELDTDLHIPGGAIVIDDEPTSSEYGYQQKDDVLRIIGNPNPDFILGFRNSFTYKNFSLGLLFDWRKGGDLLNGTNWALSSFGKTKQTADTREESPIVLDGVVSDGSPNDIPIVRDESYWRSSVGGFGIGEPFVQDGGWIKLREVSLSYSLPPSIFKDSFVKSAVVSFVGRNLWYNWAYDGVDPETSLIGTGNGQGVDYFNLPSTKSVMFKLSVDF